MPLGASEPAARDGVLKLCPVVVGQERGHVGGAGEVPGVGVALVRALARLHVAREPAAPERGLGEELEVLRRELGGRVGLLQKRIGGLPVAAPYSVAACFEGGFDDLAHALWSEAQMLLTSAALILAAGRPFVDRQARTPAAPRLESSAWSRCTDRKASRNAGRRRGRPRAST